MTHKRVVIIGGGFGGMTAARFLRDAEVILIDRTNHHVFQPLLYQVATAALSPSDIAWPLHTLFRSQSNVRVVMDDVMAIDRTARVIQLRDSAPISFDVLIVAPSSRHAYFGHDEWEASAPGLKTMADAVHCASGCCSHLRWRNGNGPRLVHRIASPLSSLEEAPRSRVSRFASRNREKGHGAGLSSLTLGRSFDHPRRAGPRILSGFDIKLSTKALTVLERMGVTVKLNHPVTAVRPDGVMVGNEWVPSTNVIWVAGNKASPLLNTLAVPQDSCGRVKVQPDLTIPNEPWIFVIGDAAHCLGRDDKPLPGIAPVAMREDGMLPI